MRAQMLGIILMVVGLVPLLAGLFNVCLIALIIGPPFAGRTRSVRQKTVAPAAERGS